MISNVKVVPNDTFKFGGERVRKKVIMKNENTVHKIYLLLV